MRKGARETQPPSARTGLDRQPSRVGLVGALEVAHTVQGSALASIALTPVGLD